MSEFEQDLASVMGSFIETELDCVYKQNQEIEQLKEKIKSLETRIKTIKRRRKKQTSLIRKYKEEITKIGNALHNKNEVIEEVREYIIGKGSIEDFDGEQIYHLGEEEQNELLKILDKVRE